MSFASHKGDLRRGTRLMLPIPIVIRGTDAKGNAFCDRTRTFSINQYGGLLETEREIGVDEFVLIENPALGQIAPAKVIHLETKPGGSGFRVAVELTEPQNIWGVDFPPSDWKSKPLRAKLTVPLPIAFPPSQTAGAATPSREVQESAPISLPEPGVGQEQDLPASKEIRTIGDRAVTGFSEQSEEMDQTGPLPIALPTIETTGATAAGRDIPESAPIALPEPVAGQPRQDLLAPEEIRARADQAVSAFAKQLEEMVQSASRNWREEMAKLGEEMRQAFREEMERWFGACLEAAAVQLRKQIEVEVALTRERLQDFHRQITEGSMQSIRTKVAAMLLALDEPNRAKAAAEHGDSLEGL